MFSVPWVSKGRQEARLFLEDLLRFQTELLQGHARLHACKSLQRRPLVTALVLAEIVWHQIDKSEWSSIRDV